MGGKFPLTRMALKSIQSSHLLEPSIFTPKDLIFYFPTWFFTRFIP